MYEPPLIHRAPGGRAGRLLSRLAKAGSTRTSVLMATVIALTPTIALADGPTERVQASGAIAAGQGPFSSFHLSVRTDDTGEVNGRATFTDVSAVGGRLVIEVNCLSIATEVDPVDGSTRRVAIMGGPVIFATNGFGIGQLTLVGLVDGDQSTPIAEPDMIKADLSLDLPGFVTCDRVGLTIETPLTRGSIKIRVAEPPN